MNPEWSEFKAFALSHPRPTVLQSSKALPASPGMQCEEPGQQPSVGVITKHPGSRKATPGCKSGPQFRAQDKLSPQPPGSLRHTVPGHPIPVPAQLPMDIWFWNPEGVGIQTPVNPCSRGSPTRNDIPALLLGWPGRGCPPTANQPTPLGACSPCCDSCAIP